MKTSLIICTKNREDDLYRAIESVNQQNLKPDELIIVDAGDNTGLEKLIKYKVNKNINSIYISSAPGLTRQRNIGIRNSTGDIISFIDDDVVLDPNYIQIINKTFAEDLKGIIGAVSGKITNIKERGSLILDIKLIKNAIHGLISKVFLLPSAGNGKFKSSGFPSHPHLLEDKSLIECLSGCCMSFRAEIFKKVLFDESFITYSYMEDDDISLKVLKLGYRICFIPDAQLIHNVSQKSRTNKYDISLMLIQNSYYLLKKYLNVTYGNKVAYCWSLLGIFILAIMSFNASRIKGTIKGIKKIIIDSNILYKDKNRRNEN